MRVVSPGLATAAGRGPTLVRLGWGVDEEAAGGMDELVAGSVGGATGSACEQAPNALSPAAIVTARKMYFIVRLSLTAVRPGSGVAQPGRKSTPGGFDQLTSQHFQPKAFVGTFAVPEDLSIVVQFAPS